ncbi:MAG: hypothetical protein A3A96_02780 [Candidatus Zambryskibacteria bacterium RIFCSPLOWO2_01_FULL_39_39]|uniref:Uncharacterized protein n=1 Tax=Candidatus Zambryskibacteria bacterium RIFCSPLOWO2_01_FULL_39_39 TaxID=1802758 RepID=A0A1G2TYC4_9BACT|nr:MAG: hypothetical protein A3A96_02780 [Candidatus Zambryskibacteria bacterium RIFCSPLOWO2_01_FULL_39_39]
MTFEDPAPKGHLQILNLFCQTSLRAPRRPLPTEAVHSLDFSSKNLNESCEAPSFRFSPCLMRGKTKRLDSISC